MGTHHDRSDKDKKYFIDGDTYNCPFCKRRHVRYSIRSHGSYDATNTKKIYFYLIRCHDCEKISFHLSNYKLITNTNPSYFTCPPKHLITEFSGNTFETLKSKEVEKALVNKSNDPMEMDEVFFYNFPTSFFTIDERIPEDIREPLNEAENSLKNNFLTGASGCLRKAIYKLLKLEKVPEADSQNKFISHEDRVDQLKNKYPKIEPELIDELKAIHTLTSQELHEHDWEDFDAATLRFLLEVTNEILIEIYVTPDEKAKKRAELAKLRTKAKK